MNVVTPLKAALTGVADRLARLAIFGLASPAPVVAALVVAAGACRAAPAIQQAPIPVADFFRRPQLSQPVLSPSGQHVAAVQAVNGRLSLVAIDLSDGGFKAVGLAAHPVSDVTHPLWVDDERILFFLVDNQSDAWMREPSRMLMAERSNRNRPQTLVGAGGRRLHSVLRDGSGAAMLQRDIWSASWDHIGSELFRLDLARDTAEIVSGGSPPHVRRWLTDAAGRPRVVLSHAEGQTMLHVRRGDDAGWTLHTRRPSWEVRAEAGAILGVLGLGPGEQLFVTTWDEKDRDTEVLATLDLSSPGSLPRTVLSTPGFDFNGEVVLGRDRRVVGAHYVADAAGTHWFDASLRAIQEAVDRRLPDTINRIDCGACDNPPNVLVTSWSDRQPPVHFVWRVREQKLEPLGRERPWMDPARMAPRSFERIRARDGLSLPLHVTRPAGAQGRLPTVVLVHGGPWIRGGDWRWSAESQFLASRGFLVLEPEFRGSAGYGRRHLVAGFRQWGRAMQDDLDDALKWAVERGWADPRSSCIVGGSYGGYAALMALVRQDSAYRCAVEYMGVTDIELMAGHRWTDLDASWMRFGMPAMVGDPKLDADWLRAVSPLHQARRIERPVLMAHGGLDIRVPPDHATRLRDALKAHNPSAELVLYPDEGHGWRREVNEVDFWTRVEAFLNRWIRP